MIAVVCFGLAEVVPQLWFAAPIFWFGLIVFCGALFFWLPRNYFRWLIYSLVIILVGWRVSLDLQPGVGIRVEDFNGQKANLIGIVTSEPDQRVRQIKYEVSDLENENIKLGGKILLTAPLQPELEFADKIALGCLLKSPDSKENPGYGGYLARYGIYSICQTSAVRIIAHDQYRGRADRYLAGLFDFKQKLRGVINHGLTEPAGALASGMILGDQRGLPQEIKDQFSRTGLSHIVAISGLNITLIAVFLSQVLLAIGLPRRQVFYLSSLMIGIYILMIGLPVSAVRAGIMSVLLLMAMELGRLGKLKRLLLLAAVAQLMINPRLLADDLGFQLSFLALLGIDLFYPWLEGIIASKTGDKFKFFYQTIAMTLAAQVLTWPVLVYNFGQLSLITPLANMLILWTLAPLTVVCFIALPLAMLLPAGALYYWLPAEALLRLILWLVKILAAPSWAAVTIDSISHGWLIAYYSLIIMLIWSNNPANFGKIFAFAKKYARI